jgi:hypothetical protein
MDRSPSANFTEKGASDFVTVPSLSQARPRAEGRATHAGERGKGTLKAIIWTLILASGVYVAFKVLPVLAAEYEFQDSMQTIARNASANGGTIEKIQDAVLKEAEKAQLPIGKDDIKVTGKSGTVTINVDYSVTVDLTLYQWTLNFHPAASNDSLV